MAMNEETRAAPTADAAPEQGDHTPDETSAAERASGQAEAEAQSPSAGAGAGGYSWEMRYRAARAKADEHFANWQRAAADMANLRRQAQKERDELVAYERAALIADLLPLLDQMEQFIATAPPFVAEDNWVRGIALLERQVRHLLEAQGLQPIPCTPHEERLDSTKHHALIRRAQGDLPEGTILAELQRGYTLGGRLLRPTLVAIASNEGSGG